MTDERPAFRAIGLVLLAVVGLTAGVGVVGGAPSGSIPSANSIAIGTTTTQSFDFDVQIPQGGISATCTVSASQLANQGVTLKSVSITDVGDASLSASVSGSDITVSIDDSDADSESGTATVTMTADTRGATPAQGLSHSVSCGSATLSAGTTAAEPLQTGEFNLEDTGIQDTTSTTVAANDSTVTNDTTIAQSVNLDLLVPDDNGSASTYTVSIDTSEARASGINVTGAALETDPTGANAKVEIVGSPTVTASENVTLTIREGSDDRNDGDVSQEVITLELTLDATQHAKGAFVDASGISHVVRDEVGSTTANLTFDSSDKSIIDRYDTNDQPGIQSTELLDGIDGFRGNDISATELLDLIDSWRTSS